MGAVTQGEERFDRWWNTAGDWVEAPNVRRGGESGVQRLQLPDGTLPTSSARSATSIAACVTPWGVPPPCASAMR